MQEIHVCRVCISNKTNLLNIFDKTEYVDINNVITKHLSFQITEQDNLSTFICRNCWTTLLDFHLFYCNIEIVQANISQQDESVSKDIEIVDIKCEIEYVETDFKGETFELKDSTQIPETDPIVAENGQEDLLMRITKKRKKKKNSNEKFIKPDVLDDNTFCSYTTIASEQISDNNDEDTEKEEDEVWKPVTTTQKKKTKKNTSDMKPVKFVKKSYDELNKEDETIKQFFKIECDICGEKYDKFHLLNSHFKNSHDKKGYLICCDTRLFSRSDALYHIKKHADPNLFKCRICDKTLANLKGLTSHMYTHSSKEDCKFKCEDCPKSYAKFYLLQSHRRRHLPTDNKKFTCEICGKIYSSKQMLQDHVDGVHNNQQYVCEICAKSFKSKAWFKIHVREHKTTIDSKVRCDKCERWCKNVQSLKKHLQKHEEIKLNLHCEICGKQAPSKTALRVHKFNLHGAGRERKFLCCICDKSFKRNLALKEHMAVHTGEDLYTCMYCLRKFKSSANMYSHRKKCAMKMKDTEVNEMNIEIQNM